ncbi:carph-isopro domain-containing protein [Phenylobacterium sp.]|uniref:carph-isopro domain-containing protein n=1 Tax=Phenylobacterium sp. TaxID=1871053 RepID=UPI003FA7379E
MRTHTEIIEAAGGYRALAERLGLPKDRVRFWARRGAIPPTQWAVVASAKVASLRELAEAASEGQAA